MYILQLISFQKLVANYASKILSSYNTILVFNCFSSINYALVGMSKYEPILADACIVPGSENSANQTTSSPLLI